MQTFLPFKDFARSAACLDRARLGKQRVEGLQLLNSLDLSELGSSGWRNHPASQMWRGYAPLLAEYTIAICTEWTSRGYKDTCLRKVLETLTHGEFFVLQGEPPWLGTKRFHLSHRSNLLRKKPEHYAEYFPKDTPDNLDYYWPKKGQQYG